MKLPGELFSDQRGMVLVISLWILALLIAAGIGAIVSVQSDFKTSGNLKTSTQAFYLAEAGIEWAKQKIQDQGANPPKPAAGTHPVADGAFTVSFLSPVKKTKVVATITVRSTGIVESSSATIEALITKTYGLSPGAISFSGREAHSSFTGDSFLVDGRDYDPVKGTVVSGSKAKVAISVPDLALEEQVRGALAVEQQDNVSGKDGVLPNVGRNEFLSSDGIAKLADDLCAATGAVTEKIPSEGILPVSGKTTWGTRDYPALRCIHGLVGEGDRLDIRGSLSGVGILVVKDADLVINGSFHWEGLILVSGDYVGFRVEGSDKKEIFGALMINERGTDSGNGTEELKLEGDVSVRYSSSALSRAAELFPESALESIYGSLPSTLTQNYWRMAGS